MTSNDERIRNWRARRQKGAALISAQSTAGPSDVDPGAAVDAAVGSAPAPANAVLAMVLEALSRTPHQTVPDRRAVYLAIQEGQERGIARVEPPEETADFHRRQLRTITRLLEADIRAGIDVFSADYAPAALIDENARLAAGHQRRGRMRKALEARAARRQASRQDVPHEVALPPEEEADLALLRPRLVQIHVRQHPRRPSHAPSRLATIIPLLILQLHIIQGESRIALLWTLAGPAVLLTLISSLYFLTGTHYILNMDVPTFALLGATTWIMFRQIIFRSSSSYVSARSLINLESVTPLASALVQALIYLFIYFVVYAVLLTAGCYFDLVTLPSSWAGFIFYVAGMAVGGASIGLIFGSIATNWPFFLRFAAVIERFLEVFSGVFFVSEQLPERYRPYFLWSPFAHGMQLLRSSYFEGYKSHDASPAYFLISIVFLAVIGVAADRSARSDVQPM
jgi:capsular polysaccharide transport system permease protein